MEVRFRKQGYTKWMILGLILAICGLSVLTVDPVGKYVKRSMTLQEGTMLYEMWKKFPIEILMKIYLFNITNAEAFMKGTDTFLDVKEIGPYVYKETRKNLNITINPNGTISYIPETDLVYMPDRSGGNVTEDIVYTANIPLLGAYSMYKDSTSVNIALNFLTSSLKSQGILNLTVYDYLWGYDDKMIKLASGFMPNWIPFTKFGLMDRMYEDNKNQIVTMDINETSPDYYTIQRWNGSPGLKQWDYADENTSKPCTMVKGSYEGLLFPPNMEGKRIRVFKKSFCRPLRLDYVEELEMPTGLTGHSYEIVHGELGCIDTYNECFCQKNKLPEGFTDLSPCNFNLPLALSFPHFYQSDPSLAERIRGFNPSYEKHSSKIILQPTIGMPMEISTKTQLNLALPRLRYNKQVKPFSQMFVPVLWMDHCVEGLPEGLTRLVIMGNKYLPLIQLIMGWLMVISGMFLFIYMFYRMMKSPSKDQEIKVQPNYSPVALDSIELTKDSSRKVEIVRPKEKTIN